MQWYATALFAHAVGESSSGPRERFLTVVLTHFAGTWLFLKRACSPVAESATPSTPEPKGSRQRHHGASLMPPACLRRLCIAGPGRGPQNAKMGLPCWATRQLQVPNRVHGWLFWEPRRRKRRVRTGSGSQERRAGRAGRPAARSGCLRGQSCIASDAEKRHLCNARWASGVWPGIPRCALQRSLMTCLKTPPPRL